jgi:predicted transcriptional regulator
MRISGLQREILRALAIVGRHGLRVGQIAIAVKRPHSTVSRSVRKLEIGRYILREKGTVKISGAGMELVRDDIRPAAEMIASIAASYKEVRSIGEQFQMSFSLVRDLAEQYRRNFRVISETATQYQSQIQEVLRNISHNFSGVRQAVEAAALQFEAASRALRPILSELAKVPAANKAVQEKLLPRGWLLSPWLPIGDFLWFLGQLETHHDLDVVESNLVERFDRRCEDLIDEICDFEPFKERKHLLDQALRAHRRGEYGLAIPVFLLAIEGVVIDSFGDDKLLASRKRWSRRMPVDKLMKAFYEAFWTTMVGTLWKSYGLRDKPPTRVLNRHMILHGRSADYDTKRNSVQAILALHYLAFIVGEHMKRSSVA